MPLDRRLRWLAMFVLCLGDLMIVLDITIVNVALPSIRTDLLFDTASLAWVVNAYTLTFGGFLLLGGRLGDLYGPRRLFLIGVALFALASLGCGLSTTQGALIAARAVQGFAGAIVSAVALSLIVNLFQEPDERAKAMGVFGFVSAGGGSVGVLLGGLLVQTLNWHWIFLVNLPVGIIVLAFAVKLLPREIDQPNAGKLDVGGAVTVTLALLLAVYAIIGGNQAGWLSAKTLMLLAGSLALLLAFVAIEARVRAPLVPLSMFGLRTLMVSNVIGMLWAAALFAWFSLSALYLQGVLGYNPMQVGLAFLPINLIMAAFSLGLSAKVVTRFGIKAPLTIGLAMLTVGLVLFIRAPVEANFWIDVLPGMLLLGLGAGLALNPLMLAAMGDVGPEQSGLASGLINTAFMMGGTLGFAILASIAAAWTASAAAQGEGHAAALNAGYHAAFVVGSIFTFVATVLGFGLGSQAKNAAKSAETLEPAVATDG